ncbi:mandelate racemase/muconate lactonizing enzyme family protein [Clostridia bacterium]|nr:mandelate racemase/muconate lactonizing enzyme family protein [Clostridia bacterium]
MKIVNAEAIFLRHPLSGEFRPTWGTGLVQTELPMTLIKIEVEDGTLGYGAIPCNGKEGVIGFDTFIKPELVGTDIFQTEKISRLLRNASLRMTWPWGVEMAVWDAVGKIAKLPIHKMWGGEKSKIPVYASLGENKPLDVRINEVKKLKSLGFAAVKLRFRNNQPKEDLKCVEMVRKELGDDFGIMVDANQADALPGSSEFFAWDYKLAYQIGKELERYDVIWLEEPLSRFDYKGLQFLNEKLNLKLAGGEKNQMANEFKQLIDDNCFDILQGDSSFSEGMFQLRKIAAYAEINYKEFIPHTWSNCIGLNANLQLAASLPNCSWFEFPYEEPGWNFEVSSYLLRNGHEIKDGFITVPQGHGLGMEFDTDRIEKYTVK